MLLPIYLLLWLLTARLIPKGIYRKIYTLLVLAKTMGSLVYAFIYLYYYEGGDTTAYFLSALPITNLLTTDVSDGLHALFGTYTLEDHSKFTSQTGYPYAYICIPSNTFTVVQVLVPLLFISFKSYILTSFSLAMIGLIGPWKLFMAMEKMIPNFTKVNAFCILFFPSTLFWGSGISKDTITFSATCFVVYGFYKLMISKNFNLWILLGSLFSLYLILEIKTYIFLGILPGAILWYFSKQIRIIRNRYLRLAMVPAIMVLSGGLFVFSISQLEEYLGDYSVDNIIDKAIVSQEDLRRDYYGGNSFDIGETDPSLVGIVSKIPLATFYGLFGPTIFQAKNIVMFFAALENTYLLIMSILIFVRGNPITTLGKILDNPLMIFCFIFSILFAFSIGFSTSNFGALVRFKIPILPFFNLLLLTVYYKRFNLKHF